MTHEELIARLRDGCNLQQRDGERDANRIETLTKERDEADALAKAAFADGASNNIRLAETSYRVKWLEAKLAKAVEALELIAGVKGPYSRPFPEAHEDYGAFAVVKSREALNELEGEKK